MFGGIVETLPTRRALLLEMTGVMVEKMKLCYCLFAVLLSSNMGAIAQTPQADGNKTWSVAQATRAPISIPVAPDQPGQSITDPIDPRFSTTRSATGAANDKTVFSPLPMGVKQATPVVGIGADYLVGPNDLLEIEVFDLENLKRTVRVNAAGAISLPLIGGVIVAGLTAEKVEEVIAKRYSEKYLQNPQVSVFIKEFTTQRITVEGAVQKPGIYPLTGQITLLRALALAGGAGQIANMGEVIVFRTSERGVRQAAVFDVDGIRSGKGDDPIIKGDDLIVVQRDNSRRLLKDSLFRDIIDSINPFSVFARP